MEQFLSTETIIIELLLIAALVAIAVHRLRIPYTVALVVVGLLITLQQSPRVQLLPEVILALFVPPLVFEAAFQLNMEQVRRSLTAILLLAIPGVVLTMLIVGALVAWGTPLALPVALVFGAIISATDPVAVVAIFRSLGAPKRLTVLIEGESLVNDGTAIVLFNLVLGVALTGQFSLADSILEFIRVAAGGTVTGLVLGWAISRLIARVDDYLIETTLTTVLAFGAYLIAEQLHFSGVLAVVAAGLVNGNLGPRGMSPTTRIVLFSFWEYAAFLVNSLVFLLIGMQINLPELLAAWQPILWAIVSVLAARVVVVYGLGWLMGKLDHPLPLAWKHVLSWGGLRGAISLALVLSLPSALGPDLAVVRVMAFGVVLFTLLAQGTTMRALLRWLGIGARDMAAIEYEMQHARLTALRAAAGHLDRLFREGMISAHTLETLKPELETRLAARTHAVRQVLKANPELAAEEMDTARREMMRAQRSAYQGLLHDGVISETVFETLTAEVDAVLAGDDLTAAEPPNAV